MAKRRQCATAAEVDTKKPKQVLKSRKKDAGNVITEKEEKIERKVKPKPRASTKRAAGKTTSSNTAVKTSKYFQSPVKEEESHGGEHFSTVTSETCKVPANTKKREKEEEEEDSEEEEDDWEEVEELDGPLGPQEPAEPVLPSEPVQIEIETPEVRKKQKRKAEFESYLRRMMNKFQKDQLVDTHKVHLMCLIANGMFRNRLCSEPDLLAITLSLLPTHFGNVAKERIDQNYVSGMHKWFRATFTLNPELPCEEHPDPRALLERRLASLSARNHQEMTHLFLLFLRSVQLFCRLVLSLQPIPLKMPPAKGKGAKTSPGAPGKSNTGQNTSKASPLKLSPGTKRPAAGGGKRGGDRGGKKAKKNETKDEVEDKVITSGGQRPKNSKRRSIASKVSYKDESNSDGEEEGEGLSDDEEFHATSEEDSADSDSHVKSPSKKKGKAAPKRSSGGGQTQVKEENVKLEEGEEEGKGTSSNGTKRRIGKQNAGPGADEWLEVFLEKSSSWVCVDVQDGVRMAQLCSKHATAPMTYVLSVDGDGWLKDLGRKYDPTWMTSSRKRRVEEEWWEETLEPFLGPEDERDAKEDKELQNKLLNKPLPISVAEYKNHPLYALKRHLLKYEAVYPSTATILGYCRGEPVYSRDCIQTLHSRDTWLKEARTVRLGEEPYKMVRGFSNRSRKARIMTEKNENDLALFGEWQTEEYQPPLAVDGKVPRNDFGNVYLFKPCMIPVGCVHVRLPNLNRVAKKLDMDAVPAVTGFDFHGGFSHAVTDGYIVCEEHEEVLRAAWSEDQELQKQKEREKREKRAMSNWTLLVKSLLIRERLKQRYSQKNQAVRGLVQGEEAAGLSSDEEGAEGGGSHPAKNASETLAMSWPRNRQAEDDAGSSALKKKTTTKREQRGQEKHMFPFEKA